VADGWAWGGVCVLRELELRAPLHRRLDSMLCPIDDFSREIDQTSKEIDARAEDDPYVEVLRRIRQARRDIAMLVIAEVGDIGRLRRPGGCAPRRGSPARSEAPTAGRDSATSHDRDRRRCAGRSSRRPSTPPAAAPPCQTYERIKARRGKQMVKVAVARRILTLCCNGRATERSFAWRPGQGAHGQRGCGQRMTRRTPRALTAPTCWEPHSLREVATSRLDCCDGISGVLSSAADSTCPASSTSRTQK
jgi:hypothetical protein